MPDDGLEDRSLTLQDGRDTRTVSLKFLSGLAAAGAWLSGEGWHVGCQHPRFIFQTEVHDEKHDPEGVVV
jgi:hypothetical protein